MTEPFENDAHDYLLNQMETARRGAFEQELQRNPAAAAALKRYADSMAGFACEVAGAETLAAADHQAVLATLAKATRTPQSVRRMVRPARVEWQRFFWPVAAALLVLLNLIEFQRPLTPSAGRSASVPAERNRGAGGSTHGSRAGTAGSDLATKGEEGRPSAQDDKASSDTAIAREAQREIDHLRANVAALRRDQDRLRAEYNAVLRLHEEQRAADRSLNRLATMELVDATSYARGERRGLVAVGRSVISEPGVVTSPEGGTPPPAVGSATTQAARAYAWSVFDETERQGTLNLYNLPAVTAAESIQVWVRPTDATEFQRVAEVPVQYYGGNGSVQYAMPDSAPPAEIVVTVEPRGSASTVPTGTTVLRGP